MAWYHRIFNLFQPKSLPAMHIRALPAGRASVDDNGALFGGGFLTVAPPSSFEENWRILTLSVDSIQTMPPAQLMELMADLSPEVSRALWDFLRLANPGWEVYAYQPGSDTVHEQATAAIDAFIATLADRHGSFDVTLNRLYMGAFMRGAFCAELVLDRRGRMPLELATPDPASIRFRKRIDPDIGEVWEPGQWQGANFISLDIPTFRYAPIDPFATSPYGRPLAAPALFACLFLLVMMHDLRRVIRQQGYPRLDISVDVMSFLEKQPNLFASQQAFQEFADNLVADVQAAYSRLQPDDAYIHTNNVAIDSVQPANSNALQGIDAVIDGLERMAIRALKTMPMMMARSDGSTDGESNRQWEILSNGIKTLQHGAETMLQRLLTMALEAQGIQADIEFRFAELRAAEALRDAQTEAMQIANERAKYEAGWTSQDEASMAITGHDADQATPRSTGGGGLVQDNGDGNEALNQEAGRQAWLAELRAARAAVERVGGFSTNGHH